MNGKLAGRVDRHHAAARLHDHDWRRDSDRLEIGLHGSGVAGDHGLDVGVDDGRAGALVFLDLGQHFGRDRHERAGRHLRDEVAGAPFVGAVEPGVQVADRNRVDVLVEEALDRRAHRGLVEGRVLSGPRVHPRWHLPAKVPGHEGGRLLPVNVVELVHPHAADLEDVAEALGGDEAGGGAGPGNDGVGRHRRPVGKGPDRRRGHSVLGERLGHPLPDGGIEIGRRGEDLLRHRVPFGRHQHDVGEGPADVHSNPIPHGRLTHDLPHSPVHSCPSIRAQRSASSRFSICLSILPMGGRGSSARTSKRLGTLERCRPPPTAAGSSGDGRAHGRCVTRTAEAPSSRWCAVPRWRGALRPPRGAGSGCER